MFYEAQRIRKMMRRCDLYVVRLLPDPNRDDDPEDKDSQQRDTARFGNSRPCVRCLRVMDTMGVNRVIFSTGEAAEEDGCIACETHTVHELLRSEEDQHCSRGDLSQRHLLSHSHACILPRELQAC
eukprot:Transcript_20991.p2 GENE.Transcript_20991~~Transcript_20991.p2  ORF type:complete len:126 (-),score=33.93 Transcript_20991:98-475(-)